MSQPLHLRYLSIIRDAALTNGTPHYVHYSFENFKKLVDEGKASWESVMTITKEHKAFDTVAALEAQPALDEDGFPKLSSNLFQGRHNNASLTECIRGQGPLPLPRSENDASAVVSKDGIWSKFFLKACKEYSYADIGDRCALRVPLLRVQAQRSAQGSFFSASSRSPPQGSVSGSDQATPHDQE